MNDTTSEVRELQEAAWRRMTPARRIELAFEMSELARDLCRARLRAEHPGWTERQISREMLRLAFLPEPLPPGVP